MKVRALVIWSKHGRHYEVKTEAMTLPARTVAHVDVGPIENSINLTGRVQKAGTIEMTELEVSFECLDCGFKTDLVDIMSEHQRDHSNRHMSRILKGMLRR